MLLKSPIVPRELIVDSFAGGGGASEGIERALGRSPDIAINHDHEAIALHRINHPKTKHYPHNVWKVDPVAVTKGQPVGLLWASPDCKHFSKAKGGKPVKRNIRDLAWVVVRWAKQVRPRVILLENVEEFQDWGPTVQQEDGSHRPCPVRKGETFKQFVAELKRQGYAVQWRELRACDYGAPTIRKRLFLIARRDGHPIVWPKPTHGDPKSEAVRSGRLLPYRTAAEIIDWSLPCHSIFLSQAEGRELGIIRPLAEKTMARIAKGLQRYVIDNPTPFIVPITHTGERRIPAVDEPLATITGANRGEHSLVAPYLVPRYGERPTQEPRTRSVEEPSPVVVPTGNGASLVSAFLAQHNYMEPGHDAREPVSTIVAKGCTQAVVSAGLLSLKGSDRRDRTVEAPHPAVCAEGTHSAHVVAFLQTYFGTLQDTRLEEPLPTATTKDRFGVCTVTVEGRPYQIVDIGMRMLAPRELYRAQGFGDDYIIDRGRLEDGSIIPITKTASIRMCGNSVCPDLAQALVAANYHEDQAVKAPRRRAVAEFPLLEAAE